MTPEQFAILSDADLLKQLNAGDRNAFNELYNKYWRQVYNHAYKRIGSVSTAQDITQDVFVQLWSSGANASIQNLPAYLYVMVRNEVFRYLEKQKRYDLLSDVALDIEHLHQRADGNVLFAEFLKSFNSLVDGLPSQQRIIFKMRFEDGLSTDKIASELDLSVKTVRNHLGRALSSLKEVLLSLGLFIFIYR